MAYTANGQYRSIVITRTLVNFGQFLRLTAEFFGRFTAID